VSFVSASLLDRLAAVPSEQCEYCSPDLPCALHRDTSPPRPDREVALRLPRETAQRLYEHVGTMPPASGSWTDELRRVLSEALGQPRPPRAS
jgi:hypothetical protein